MAVSVETRRGPPPPAAAAPPRRRQTPGWVWALVSVGSLLALWQLASATGIFGLYSPRLASLLLPPPTQIVDTFVEQVASGQLPANVAVSFMRVMVGFTLASLFGIAVGLGIAANVRLNQLVSPIVRLIQPIPGIAWVPLAIIWFGLGDKAAFFVIAISSFVPVLLNVVQGATEVDRNLVRAARTLGATPRQIYSKVILPSIVPYLITGLKIGLGLSWRGVVAAEMVGVPSGLGYMLVEGRGVGRTDITILSMVCLGLIMVIIEAVIFRPIERRMRPWRTA